jgi:hypothetical protein
MYYKKGKVYKIICIDNPEICYIGSTFKSLGDRFSCHCCGSTLNSIRKCAIAPYIKEFGINKFKIQLIKEYKVCDAKHLKVYEQLAIARIKNINKFNAFYFKRLTDKDYYAKNKEKIKATVNKYRLDNIDVIKKRKKEYREKNKEKIRAKCSVKTTCECGTVLNKSGLKRHLKSQKHLNLV